MKNNPKYVRPPKSHTLLDQFYMNLIPYSRYARTVLDCKKKKKKTFFSWIFGEPDTPSWHSSAPPPGVAAKMTSPMWYCFVLWLFYGNILSTNGVEGEITPLFSTTSIMHLFCTRRRHGEAGYAALDVYSKHEARDYLYIGMGLYVQTLEPYWALPFSIITRSREKMLLLIWIIMRTHDLNLHPNLHPNEMITDRFSPL